MNMMDSKPPKNPDPITRLLFAVASVDPETMAECPEADWSTARAVGLLMIFTWCYQSVLFYLIATRLFGTPGETRPELVAASVALATFILLIDRLMVIHSGWHLSGFEELKRCGGLDISGGVKHRIKSAIFLVIRLVLSVGIAQLSALFLSLIVYQSDIDAKIRSAYQGANASVTERVTAGVEADIQRARETLKVEDGRYNALAGQAATVRQNQIDPAANDPQLRQAAEEVAQLLTQKTRDDEEVRRAEKFASDEAAGIKSAAGNSGHAGNGPRRRAALEQVTAAQAHVEATGRALDAARGRLEVLRGKTAAAGETARQQATSQTPEFERALAAENAERARLQDRLTALEQGRAERIRQALLTAPDYLPPAAGLLTQIRLLGEIAASDPHLRFVILLIELTSFGFELAAVLGKAASYTPTVYSAVLARNLYMTINAIVDRMMATLNRAAQAARETAAQAADGPIFGDADFATQGAAAGQGAPTSPAGDPLAGFAEPAEPDKPAKRPRGRPRKTVVH